MTTLRQRLLRGDALTRLAALPDNSIDSIVTDPPYEINFMGKGWDGSGIANNPALWAECLRVLKPGGHLLSFGATRTYHRMAVAIEDAGFEIRDSIHWSYGSGFPKSLDVSKAIDKQRRDRADIYKVTAWVRAARDAAEITNKDIDAAFGFAGMAGHWTSGKSQPAVPTLDQVPTLLDVLGVKADDVPADIRRLLWDLNGRKGQPGENWAKREVVGTGKSAIANKNEGPRHTVGASKAVEFDITAPATDAAKTWEGWGTALKPSHEPIVVARKPLTGTVAANVLAHGTGALNIDGCRVGADGGARRGPDDIGDDAATNAVFGKGLGLANAAPRVAGLGRWPANTVLTHAAGCANGCVDGCPVAELDQQSGKVGAAAPASGPTYSGPSKSGSMAGAFKGNGATPPAFHNDQGGASRFFTVTEWDPIADAAPFLYIAKPSKKERNAGLDGMPKVLGADVGAKRGRCQPCARWANSGEGNTCSKCDAEFERSSNAPKAQANHHPTVKPVALMRHLVRLVTPPGGVVLDPFLGSGTTAVAAILEGFGWVGCEMTDEYVPIIRARVRWAKQQTAVTQTQGQPPAVDDRQPPLPLDAA
jgi:DNA modification methylase